MAAAPHAVARPGLPAGAVAVGAAAAALALGRLAGVMPVAAAGAAVLLVVLTLKLPEVMVGLYLASGVIKANPALSGLPVDVTLLTAACVALAVAVSVARDGVPPIPRAAALFPALMALMLLSVLWSPDPATGLAKAIAFESLTLLSFACAFVLFRTRAQVERLMVALVAVGLFVSLTAVETVHEAGPLVAAGSNEIALAFTAAWGMLAALGYLLVLQRGPWRLLWIVAGAILGLTVMQAGSRGVLVGTAAGLGYLVVQLVAFRPPGWRLLAATVGAGAVVAVVAGSQLAGRATAKYADYLFNPDLNAILVGREWILTRGMELAAAHPLGIGAGGFQWETGWEHSHNMFFELSSEQGLVGVALALALIAAAWHARSPRRVRTAPEAAVLGATIVLLVVLALFVNGPNDSRPLWFTLGLSLALPQLRRGRTS
jgi:O-antigen ligase